MTIPYFIYYKDTPTFAAKILIILIMNINRTYRVFLDDKTSAITIRIRWQSKKMYLYINLGSKWEKDKWDLSKQRPKLNTSSLGISYKEISNLIDRQIESIDNVFSMFEVNKHNPTKEELKDAILTNKVVELKNLKFDFDALFEDFLKEKSDDRNWKSNSHRKYLALWNNLHKICPDAFNTGFTKDTLNKLKNKFIEKQYSNVTITRIFKSIRAILTYFKAKGVEVEDSVINYKVKLTVVRKTVVCLSLQELMQLYKFKFNSDRLDRVKDAWCFMAFTGLRFSDMQNLTWDNVFDDHIEFIAQKTFEVLSIPLINEAKEILSKIKSKANSGNVFPKISNDKFNDYIKEAAKEAKLDREISTKRISGTTPIEKKVKLHEIISSHAGRRTFVSVAIGLRIPPSIIMSITGHSDYDQMRPYIAISDDTKKLEMQKFESQPDPNTESDDPSLDNDINIIKSLSSEQREALMNMAKMMQKR